MLKYINVKILNYMSNSTLKEATNVGKTEGSSRVKFKTFECPFDLEMIFSLQYDTRGLKGVLEFILENMGEMN